MGKKSKRRYHGAKVQRYTSGEHIWLESLTIKSEMFIHAPENSSKDML
jgi:hypothetical protein